MPWAFFSFKFSLLYIIDMLDEIISEVMQMPTDLTATTGAVEVSPMPDISLDVPSAKSKKDIFSIDKQKSWDKSVEARCDFQFRLRLTRRASTDFISIWQKSIFGRTLTDIKSDDSMVPFFADSIVPIISQVLGTHLSAGQWAIVATPMRRHKERNFASRIAETIASRLSIPFYFDCAHCHSKHRVGAVFTPNNIPHEPNVIVFDDFCTTGSTLSSMRVLLEEHGKNCVFFCGINNKL